MKNKTTLIILALILIALLCISVYRKITPKPAESPAPAVQTAAVDPLNATYTIDGAPVTLINGTVSTAAAPGSASMEVTKMFSQPTLGDLNGDGVDDAAVVLVRSGAGSGTFYYVAAALSSDAGTKGTNAVLLGDRIAPDTLQVQSDTVIANYADRKPDEPMTASPSVGVSKYLVAVNGSLQEIPVADIYPLYSKLSWGSQKAAIVQLGGNFLPPLHGFQVDSEPIVNTDDISKYAMPFVKYYDAKLKALGWAEDLSLAAAGPGSEVVAYRDRAGGDYVILKYSTDFKGGAANEPVACPCDVSFTVFVGSAGK